MAGNSQNDFGARLNLTEGAAATLDGLSATIKAFKECSNRCRAGRFHEDSLVGSEPLLGRKDFGVLDDLKASSGFGNGIDCPVPAGRPSNPDCRGHGLGVIHRGSMIEGS